MKFLINLSLFFTLQAMAQTSFDKAQILLNQGKPDLAKLLFEKFLEENPNDIKTIEYLGDISGSKKNWDKSIFYYEKLKKIKPSEANYFYKYGGALGMKAKESNKFKALGLIPDVKAAFEKAIELNPKHIEARYALIELYLQLPSIVGGSETKAQKYANELLNFSPVDGNLAFAHIQEYFNRFQKAEFYYLKAHEIGNSKTTFQKLYDFYQKKMKNQEKAKKLKEQFEKK